MDNNGRNNYNACNGLSERHREHVMATTSNKVKPLYTTKVAKLIPYRNNPNTLVKLVKSPPKRKK